MDIDGIEFIIRVYAIAFDDNAIFKSKNQFSRKEIVPCVKINSNNVSGTIFFMF